MPINRVFVPTTIALFFAVAIALSPLPATRRAAALALCAWSCASASDVLNIDELRLLAAQRPVARTLAVVCDVLQEPSGDASSGHIPRLFKSVLVDASSGRFALERSLEVESHDGDSGVYDAALRFDGEVQAAYLPAEAIGVLKQGADVEGRSESAVWGVFLLGEPQPGGLGIDDGSLESFLAHGVVRDELELVGEAPCHVVDAYLDDVRYATVWLDAERDLLPLRRVTYALGGGVASSVTVDSFVFLEDDGLWLPTSWETVIQARGETLRTQTAVEPQSIQVNPPVSVEDFEPAFPPGTVVTDQLRGQVYRVTESGGIGEILFESRNGEWAAVAPSSGTPPRAAREALNDPPPGKPATPWTIFDVFARIGAAPAIAPGGSRPVNTGGAPEAARGSVAPPADDSQPVPPQRAAPQVPAPAAPQSAAPVTPAVVWPAPAAQPWGRVLTGAALGLALAGVLWRVVRGRRSGGMPWLIGGLGIAGYAVVLRALYVPAPASAVVLSGVRPSGFAWSGATDYELADGEQIRFIPNPDPDKRRRLLELLGSRSELTLMSIAVEWDGAPGLRSITYGTEYVPRRLLHVLSDSLRVPLYQLDGIEVAREIGLSGDWVVRPDASVQRRLDYLQDVVQRCGYPGFRIVRAMEKRVAYDARGAARAPDDPIPILPPHPEASEGYPRRGTLQVFFEVLSEAIGRPISPLAEPADLRLRWRDNSRAYLDLGPAITDQMIATLLEDVSSAIGVTFHPCEVESAVWRLELAP